MGERNYQHQHPETLTEQRKAVTCRRPSATNAKCQSAQVWAYSLLYPHDALRMQACGVRWPRSGSNILRHESQARDRRLCSSSPVARALERAEVVRCEDEVSLPPMLQVFGLLAQQPFLAHAGGMQLIETSRRILRPITKQKSQDCKHHHFASTTTAHIP